MPTTTEVEVYERDREVLEAMRHEDETLADVVASLTAGLDEVPEVAERIED